MGRSSSSCLKIIACGSDAADNHDVDVPEAKASSDKRGWSFRKRSGKHRVLGNNVSSETPTAGGKESPQLLNSDFQSPIKSPCPDEKSQLSKKEEKNTEDFSAKEHCDETKTSPGLVISEKDSSLKHAEPDMCSPEFASENSGTPTPVESEATKAAVLMEKDENTTLLESQVVDAVVVSEVDSNVESTESKTNQSLTISEDGDVGVVVDELAVIFIQSAIRGFLARRRFVKLKSAVKLQAAVRGHLVRKSAVETLHCIRAIVKFQALVRARSSKFTDKRSRPNDTQFSTVKLLKNSFARQLLESTPKHKAVNIRCDPLKPNSSAWGWLERWMSVSTFEVAQKSESYLEPEDNNQVQQTALQPDAEDTSIARFYSVKSKFITDEALEALQTEENHAVHDVTVTDPQSCHLLPQEEEDNPVKESSLQEDAAENSSMIRFYSVKSKFITDKVEEESLENEEIHVLDDVHAVNSQSFCSMSTEENTKEIIPGKIQLIQEEVAPVTAPVLSSEISHPQVDTTSHTEIPPSENEESKLSIKRSASEELEGEGKKFMYVPRKASNPAFIAAQSKFEELTTSVNSDRAISSSPRDTEAKSHIDTASSMQETAKNTEPSLIQFSASSDSNIHSGGSECGTELSISSTLDSPDRSDIGIAEGQQENKFLEEASCEPTIREGPDGEANVISGNVETDVPSKPVQQEEIHGGNDVSVSPVETNITSNLEQKLETSSDLQTNIEPVSSVSPDSSCMESAVEQNGYGVQIESDPGTDHQTRKVSSEASPESHMTALESQGTPSSQVSVKGKRNKTDRIGSNVKRSSLSLGKKSNSKSSPESGVRSSAEHLPKDHKSGKRRNSFGSTKSDNADQEPRDSSSRNPLPSYMQATESARAKANSPRSSPDVHDKDVSIKKRHSLPGASGRQGSPHIQRSASQVTQGAKANGSSERKWQR